MSALHKVNAAGMHFSHKKFKLSFEIEFKKKSGFLQIGKQCRPRSEDLHCLLIGISIKNKMKMKTVYQPPLKIEMDTSN